MANGGEMAPQGGKGGFWRWWWDGMAAKKLKNNKDKIDKSHKIIFKKILKYKYKLL